MTAQVSSSEPISRDAIVAEARSWIGTPYRHQASKRHVGVDCIGLVRGVWRALVGDEPEKAPNYSPLWAEEKSDELLLNTFRKHLVEKDAKAVRVGDEPFGHGDVVVMRMHPRGPAKHAAITTQDGTFIHAYAGNACIESPVPDEWRQKIVARFDFPGVA